ncbi:hypothetical protein CC2G_003752 [Coprinopsis cinerea AmutBmut pab1-1]|nr:hypothetical protein CC2G_003752 [Coprinopsis cinerea AmutBmut pab1-1]
MAQMSAQRMVEEASRTRKCQQQPGDKKIETHCYEKTEPPAHCSAATKDLTTKRLEKPEVNLRGQ